MPEACSQGIYNYIRISIESDFFGLMINDWLLTELVIIEW